jgi:hypothetical protein
VWWRSKLDAGRTSAELGVTSGMALLEWAASPDDDPGDEAVWQRTMPALGRLIRPETVRLDLANMGAVQFKRSHLNIWSDEAAEGWSVINRAAWEASRL